MVDFGKIISAFLGIFIILTLLSNLVRRWPQIPGDIYIDKFGFKVYIPWLSSLILSVIITVYYNYFR